MPNYTAKIVKEKSLMILSYHLKKLLVKIFVIVVYFQKRLYTDLISKHPSLKNNFFLVLVYHV